MSRYDERPAAAITSPSNPRVRWLVSLRKRRTRDAERVTVVEGHDELRLAIDAGVVPRNLFVCPELVGDPSQLALVEEARALGSEVLLLGVAAFAKASYRAGPDGWLAVLPEPSRPLDDIALSDQPLVLVCEGVEKPGNLGAMVRTAEAAGVDAVIAASPVADWGNPNVVRASKGTVFALPVAAATSPQVQTWLQSRRLRIVVATPDSDRLVTTVDLTGPTAIVVGAEHAGVSKSWLDVADGTARLPMFGQVNSLNVATSAAIVIYEAIRQRS
jgi:TrmH family RNA methyltransferase